MSVEELKAVVDGATEEERHFLGGYLRIKMTDGDGLLRAALAAADQRMTDGSSVSLERFKELHQQSEKLGF